MGFQNFRNYPVQYVQATNRPNKKPVYFVKFGAIVGPLGTNSVPLTQEFASGSIYQPTKVRPRVLGMPQQISNTVTMIAGKASIGSTQFILQDDNNVVTEMYTNQVMKNRKATIMAGYTDLPEKFFIPIYTGQVNDFQLMNDDLAYTVTLVDSLSLSKASILTAKTILALPIGTGDVVIPVKTTAGFAAATDLNDGRGPRNYLRIGDEIISYTGVTANTFTGCTRGVILSQNGSVPVVANQADAVINYILYDENPLTMALQILLSTGTGTNWSGTGRNYDVLPKTQGIGIPYDQVNIANIESQRDRFISWLRFSNFLQDTIEAKKLIEEEILAVINAYPVINRAGQYDVKVWTVPLPTIDAITLDDTNIIGVPQYQGNYPAPNFINDVEVDFDWQPVQNYYFTNRITINSDSQQKYREDSPFVIQSKFIRSYLKGERIADRITGQIIRRFKDPPPKITLQVDYTLHLVNPGDIVFLNSSLQPNILKGKRGGGQPVICEVTSCNPAYSQGRVNLTLIGIGFTAAHRYGAISPSGWPTYTNANEDQRRYAFVSELAGSGKGVMSNGDDGYYVTP